MRIIFIRHGEPNYEKDCLTETGKKQAAACAERLEREGIAEIYASPMGRAAETASFTAKRLGLPVHTLDFMHEISWGGPGIPQEGHPCGAGQGKQVLRNVLYRHVPKELVDRPKKGFSVPIGDWLKTPELKSWAEDLIAEDKLKREGYLNPKVVHKIWSDFTKEGGAYQPLIWYILMFEQWLNYDIM